MATHSVELIARLLELQPTEVWSLSRRGVLPSASREGMDLAAAVQGFVRHLRGAIAAADSAATTVSVSDLANSLGISERAIREHERLGHIVKAAKGRYDLAKSVHAYCTHLRAMASGRGEAQGLVLASERARLAREQADAQQMRNALQRGELVSVVEVEQRWSDVLRRVRNRILAVPSRVRHHLGHLRQSEVDVIDRELRDALTALGTGAASSADHTTGRG